jgi:hypothetical protein
MANLYEVKRKTSSALPLILILISVFLGNTATSQLVVTSGGTPQQIISSFIGAGLTVSNPVINCGANAYGTFNGSASNLGLSNGLLLTTGTTTVAVGPNNSESAGYCWQTGPMAADPDLTAIEPLAQWDKCVLEFDVIPHCQTMSLRFVFGSEEYPEFVDLGFSDAFGFFISGPAADCTPNGYVDSNVALLPNGATVEIDSINYGNQSCPIDTTGPCTNCSYYVNNCGGSSIQYDAFTTPIVVTLNVCPCATYHWKFIIADAGDCIYDSGVFIDSLYCTNSFSYNVTTTNASCSCDGTAAVNIMTGSPPYSYSWSPSGQTGQTATGLCPGTHTVSVTDLYSCNIPTVQTFTINSVSNLTTAASNSNITCYNQNNGIAIANPANGNGQYTYSWSTTPPQSTQTVSNLAAGTYTVTVTDATGCVTSTTVTVTQPPLLTAAGSTLINVSCYGGNNGSAYVTPGGGTGAYTYTWLPSGGSGATASNLTANSYTVVIADANGCTATTSTTITQPPVLTASGSTITNVSCYNGANGSIRVTPLGGTGPYTYSWTPSGGNGSTASNLSAMIYTAIVTDANGCTVSSTATVTQPPQITASGATIQNVSCANGNNGSVYVTPGGGTGAYTFAWSPSGGNGATASNLTANSYTVTVTDANGCSTTSTATVTQPATVTAAGSTLTNVSCFNGNNGSATVTPGGGTGTYTFQWSPSGGNGATASNLTAGAYTVVVTDANGCSASTSTNITQPAQLTAAVSASTNISCNGGNNGSATVTAGGGSGTYTYAWNTSPVQMTSAAVNLGAGSYTVVVADANGCTQTATVTLTEPTAVMAGATALANISCSTADNGVAAVSASGGTGAFTYQWSPSGGNAATASNLSGGNYTVTVTDNNGCSTTATVAITQTNPVTASAVSSPALCSGASNGSAIVTAGGGSGAGTYTYQWSPSGGNGVTAGNITAGTYTVVVTDANGCTQTATTTVTEPPLLTSSIPTGTNVLCFNQSNGSATANAAGGSGAYTFAWNTSPVQTSSVASNLPAGNYTVLVTDANGCTTSSNITITQPTQLGVTIPTTVDELCNGASTGSAVASANGGSPNYSYQWSPAGGTGASANNLPAGNYTVVITDNNGCTAMETTTITEPPALTLSVNTPNVICISQSATISATATGRHRPV